MSGNKEMPSYFDESVHDRGGFILGAFVHGPDPTDTVDSALQVSGLTPGQGEFKSSAPMHSSTDRRALRRNLQRILSRQYLYGVVVLPASERRALGKETLRCLAKIIAANGLTETRQSAYFDEGVFASAHDAAVLVKELGVSEYCDVFAEQDSRTVRGLQLADLIAHTFATMLLDTMGLITKRVKAGPASGYDPDLDVDLGFELWAGVRYQFFCGNLPAKVESNDDMIVDVSSYGLHVADTCPLKLRNAAFTRFGTQYLGCIH